MNILIPHTWLLDHLNTKADPDTIRTQLSLCGPSVERINIVDNEPVYDIEVTTNRVDMMSVRGIAREASAILPEFGSVADLLPLKVEEINHDRPLDLDIQNDPVLCHRILAIKLEDVELKPSPDWLQKRLLQVGQRPINNVIDITNYIMWEIGHPIHAFDYDRLTQKRIIVKLAQKGETLTTLDHITHTLQGGEVVFDDGTGTIIDLPGIMGTANSVVTDTTKNVLLWIESVDAVKIRQASMSLAIRSQAAILNEKSVDPNLGDIAIKKAVGLLKQLSGATIGSQLFDTYPNPQQVNTVTLEKSRLKTYMGLDVPSDRVSRILSNLGCNVVVNDLEYVITPPSWRSQDLKIPQDYIEEVARIYGYHNLPSVVMVTPIPDHPPAEDFHFELSIKQWLAGWGAQEIYTYSMVSKDLALASGFSLEDHLAISNPLTDDGIYLRRSLLPSLAGVFSENPGIKLTIFELQNTYHPQGRGELPQEELHLSVVTNNGFPHLKGIFDALSLKFHLESLQIKPISGPPEFIDSAVGEIMIADKSLGLIGRLKNNPDLHAFDVKVSLLQQQSSLYPRSLPIYTHPPIIEDLTFTLKPQTYVNPVITTMLAVDPLVVSVSLKGIYHQNYTFTLHYRDPQKSLTDKDISPLRNRIILAVASTHQAELVGQTQS